MSFPTEENSQLSPVHPLDLQIGENSHYSEIVGRGGSDYSLCRPISSRKFITLNLKVFYYVLRGPKGVFNIPYVFFFFLLEFDLLFSVRPLWLLFYCIDNLNKC